MPSHITHRGNDRGRTFFEHDDYRAYLLLLKRISQRYATTIHAYVLMTNHVHLLMTSATEAGLSRTMQQTASHYTRRINRRYERTGTLWEGRHRSSLVDSDRYCLSCYRYIELNPVRAGMVAHPKDYRWSSYHENTGRRALSIVEPHASYLAIAESRAQRVERYRAMLGEPMTDSDLSIIRHGTRKGLPIGDDAFRERVERTSGKTIGARKRGRPRKREAPETLPGRSPKKGV